MSKRLVIFCDLQTTGMHYTALWDSKAVNTPHSPAISVGILFDLIEAQLAPEEQSWFYDGPRDTPEAVVTLGERALAREEAKTIGVTIVGPTDEPPTLEHDIQAPIVTVRYLLDAASREVDFLIRGLRCIAFCNELLVALSGGETYYYDLTELLALPVWQTGGICEVSAEPPLKNPLPTEGELPVDNMEMLYCPARGCRGCSCH